MFFFFFFYNSVDNFMCHAGDSHQGLLRSTKMSLTAGERIKSCRIDTSTLFHVMSGVSGCSDLIETAWCVCVERGGACVHLAKFFFLIFRWIRMQTLLP